jgi:hypothetical protein
MSKGYVSNGNQLVKDTVKVEWDELGEGISGDYNPNDKEDIELLRFTVSKWIDDHWEQLDDCSYCTQMPVSATPEERLIGLRIILDHVYEPITNGNNPKKLCEFLSWISMASLKDGIIEKRWMID